MKLRIGITGGIGSGKSLVSSLFALNGIPVYNADLEARRIMENNADIHQGLVTIFGAAALVNAKPDRKYISSVVFHDSAKLQALNELVHPFVLNDFIRWEKEQDAPYTLREAAILFETGIWKQLDHTILVDAPESLRMQRVMLRDGRNENEIQLIFARQWSSEKKRTLAWRIIENDDHQLVIPQVNAIHKELIHA